MLPKTAEYALRTVVWLARHPNLMESADRLAEGTKVPRRYLHRVLQALVRAKLVRSQFGPGGETWLRINFATPRPILEQALARLDDAFDDLRTGGRRARA